jgi:hypothetical protein
VRQRRQLFRQNLPVVLNIPCPDLQQVIKPAGNHMALFYLDNCQNAPVERLQCRLARVRQAHLDESHMCEAKLHRIQLRAVAHNRARFIRACVGDFESPMRRASSVADIRPSAANTRKIA